MTLLASFLALLSLLLAVSTPAPSYTGMYAVSGDVLELHRGPDGALRGYLRTAGRFAALAPIEVRDGMLHATATDEEGARSDVVATPAEGEVLRLAGRAYRRLAVERPADAAVRREIEQAYARLAQAVEAKDFEAFQALRLPAFATIPPDGVPKSGPSMAERARTLLQAIQPPIKTSNDVLELAVRGDEAIATVRQKFTRRQAVEGTPHEIHTEVTQRETWTRTPHGWKLSFVDEVRDHAREDRGAAGK